MESILGGVYLIRSINIEYYNGLPKDILSPVECGVCDLYPKYYPYLNYREKHAESDQKELKLTNTEFKDYEKYVESYFINESSHWSPVFKSIEDAKLFKEAYLKNLNGVHIIAISLTGEEKSKLLHELSLGFHKDESYGIRNTLNTNQVSGSFGEFLGYDVLGFIDGYFHSPICYSLVEEIAQKLSHDINKNGKYKTHEAALEISEYLKKEYAEVNVGESYWLPWLIWRIAG